MHECTRTVLSSAIYTHLILYDADFQMMASTLIHATILGVFMLHSTAAQSCSTPLQAAFTAISNIVVPELVPDPNYTYYRETLRFTDARVEQEKENAIQYYDTQFGLDFSDAEPNELGQRFVENAMFQFNFFPANFTAVGNNWIANGNTRSKCFNIGGGGFEVTFNGSMMLHGVYGGEEGKPVQGGETIVHGYLIIFDACDHQPIIIQAQAETPGRSLPVEGWFIEEFKLYNPWLGRGRLQSIFIGPQDPTMPIEVRQVISFP